MSGTVCYRFGPFVLEPDLRRLLRDSDEIALPPKAFDVLVLLVRARHRVLTKHELLDVVWRGTNVLDNTLTQRIREIREALGDEARNSRYVRTISRVGFRFVAEVTSEPRMPGAIAGPPTPNGPLADDLMERFSRALIERILSEFTLRQRVEGLMAYDSR